jgi:hypothetical protein
MNKNVESLAKKIKNLTEENAHTEALLELALFLSKVEYVKALEEILSKQSLVGFITEQLMEQREKIRLKLMNIARKDLKPDEFAVIRRSF